MTETKSIPENSIRLDLEIRLLPISIEQGIGGIRTASSKAKQLHDEIYSTGLDATSKENDDQGLRHKREMISLLLLTNHNELVSEFR